MKPLTPYEALSTLAHRKTALADRLRRLHTKFGMRSQRVFLVWSSFDGAERGEGNETLLAEIELLPTPHISDLSSLTYRPYGLGTFKEGSVRVDQVSADRYTRDMLVGLSIPVVDAHGCLCGCQPLARARGGGLAAIDPEGVELNPTQTIDFWWEMREDGRGDQPPARLRYRVLGVPHRDEGKFGWSVNLEMASEELSRLGLPQIGPDFSEKGPEQQDLDETGAL